MREVFLESDEKKEYSKSILRINDKKCNRDINDLWLSISWLSKNKQQIFVE